MPIIYLKNNSTGIQTDFDRKSVTMNIKWVTYFALKDNMHCGHSKLIQPDTLKDLFHSAHVWSFCSSFTMHGNKKCSTTVPPSALWCAGGQNLIFPPLLLSPDTPVLLNTPEVTY